MYSYVGAAKAAQILHMSREAIRYRIAQGRFIPPEVVISHNLESCGIKNVEDIGRVFGYSPAFTSADVTRSLGDTLGWSTEKVIHYGFIEGLINQDGTKNENRTIGFKHAASNRVVWDTRKVPAKFYLGLDSVSTVLNCGNKQVKTLVGDPDVVVTTSAAKTSVGWEPSRLLVVAGLVHG